jgi:hypothetical protein
MTDKNRSIAIGTAVTLIIVGGVCVLMYFLWRSPRSHSIVLAEAPTTKPVPQGTASQPMVVYSDGTTVQFMGLRDWPEGKPWHGADGSVVPDITAPLPIRPNFSKAAFRIIEFRFKVEGEKSRWRDFQADVLGATGRAEAWPMGAGTTRHAGAIVSLSKNASEANVEVGCAIKPWQTKLEVDLSKVDPATAPTTQSIRLAEVSEDNGRTRIVVLDEPNANDRGMHSLTVMTKLGRPLKPAFTSTEGSRFTYEFAAARKDISKVQYQVRPVEWRVLGKIPLPVAAAP